MVESMGKLYLAVVIGEGGEWALSLYWCTTPNGSDLLSKLSII